MCQEISGLEGKLMRPQKLQLSDLRLDGGTQPRGELNDDRVAQYAEAYHAGQPMPPVSVVYDGRDYWLYDGFHRVSGATQAGLTFIQANVAHGTQVDAQWLSFAANIHHDTAGLYRSNADKRRAVQAALGHPKGQGMSDNAIAEHVGVSHTFVSTIRRATCNGCKSTVSKDVQGVSKDVQCASKDSTANGSQSTLRTGRDGRTIDTAKIGRKPATKPLIEQLQSDEPEEIKAAVGIPPADDDEVPFEVEGPEHADQVGHDLDKLNCDQAEGIRAAFARRPEVLALIDDLRGIKHAVLASVNDRDPLYMGINSSAWQSDLTNAERLLKAILPHAVCPYCSGDGCKACGNQGWVGVYVYDQAPAEYKGVKQ